MMSTSGSNDEGHGEFSELENLLAESDDQFGSELLSESPEQDYAEEADDSPVIAVLNQILDEAPRQNASHIHFQPTSDQVLVRYRVDGLLSERMALPKRLHPTLSARVKVIAGMDLTERRLPQGGRFSRTSSGGNVLFAVETAPTLYGERITLRLGYPDGKPRSMSDLGLSCSLEELLRRVIEEPQGLFVVAGPTGSGKTTTLYALLSATHSPEKNLMTIESPIERALTGISQMEAASVIGVDVPRLVTSAKRQDADVVMCSKLDDCESAGQIIQMALAGHLILAGMHANDSVSVVLRLVDMGLEPALIGSCLLGVLAQRLVRRICTSCRQTYKPGEEELKSVGLRPSYLQEGVLWRGRGCDKCRKTGYSGRIALHEIFEMDDSIRETIRSCPTRDVLRERAAGQGLRTLRSDGAERALQGLTTIEEVLRVTPRRMND